MRSVIVCLLAGGCSATSVWPAPAYSSTSSSTISLKSGFDFKSASTSPRLAAAFVRAIERLKGSGAFAADGLDSVTVSISSLDETLAFGVDESYELNITGGSAATISSATLYGALHALETFVQLADEYGPVAQENLQVPAEIHIRDAPRFAWRGLMIDTARHYYPVPFIKHIIDTMAYVKLNVLHVHWTDDQSFPIESSKWPKLSSEGAFKDPHGHPLTYTHSNLTDLVDYARDRGVLVVPEIDMPAHTSAWGAGYPEYMAQVSGKLFSHGDALRPDLDETYTFLDSLLGEFAALFPTSEFLHLGGDELPKTAWAGNETVAAWMKAKGFDNDAAMAYFVNRVKAGPQLVAASKTLVYWEEVFTSAGPQLPKDTVVQAWKSNAMPGAIAAGHRVTNSYKWYLNHGCNNYGDGLWQDFYENEPFDFVPQGTPPEQLARIVGGETTMWAECVDTIIFDAIVWLRTAAAAEKLWSPQNATANATANVVERLAEARCRLVSRGVRAAPLNDGSDVVKPGVSTPARTFVGGCI